MAISAKFTGLEKMGQFFTVLGKTTNSRFCGEREHMTADDKKTVPTYSAAE